MFMVNQIQQTAMPWLAYELTHSPFLLGLASAVQAIPVFLLSLFGGVILDRVQKRNVMLVTQVFTVLLTLAVAILIATDLIQYWHLVLVSFISGINQAFNMPARTAMIAELVPRNNLFNAIALNNGGMNATQIAGPALAGVLIAAFGTEGAYFAGTGFAALAVLFMVFLPATSKLDLVRERSVLKNVVEGLKYLRLQTVIIILLVMEIALTIFGMSFQGLMPVFAELLEQDPEGYGFMFSAVGIGSLLGSLFIASLGNFKRKGVLLIFSAVLFGVALLLFANSSAIADFFNISGGLYISLIALIIVGAAIMAYMSSSNTIIQMTVSDEFRGRISSVYGMVVGFYPVSMLVSGGIAELLGAPMTVSVLAGTLIVFMLGLALLNRSILKQE